MLKERKIFTVLAMYISSITDTFARSQKYSILRSCPRLMFNVPAGVRYLTSEVKTGPVIFASLLDLVFQISQKSTVERRELYLRTALDNITDWLHPDHPY